MFNFCRYAHRGFGFFRKLKVLIFSGVFGVAVTGFSVGWAQDVLQPMPAFPEALSAPIEQVVPEETARQTPDEQPSVEPIRVKLTRAEKLDKLFAELLKSANEVKAKRIAAQISAIWGQSGSATVDLLLGWSYQAMNQKKYAIAIDFLDEAVALAPDNAESWNRRAALHALNHDYNRAIYDINRVLELEPRHFGALTGLANILQESGHKASALKVYQRVLQLYPMMREAQRQVQFLTEELSDIHI